MNLPLTKQDYSPKPSIAGVQIVDLKLSRDDGGYFLELSRFSDHIMQHFPEFNLQQLNLSEMDPGVIKAWHIHHQQDDIWFIPPSHRLLIGLRDIREASATKDVTLRFVAGGGRGQLIFIPRGVAHGAANLWQQPAMVVYLVNQQFNPDPAVSDEFRLPWDYFGADIWQQTKG